MVKNSRLTICCSFFRCIKDVAMLYSGLNCLNYFYLYFSVHIDIFFLYIFLKYPVIYFWKTCLINAFFQFSNVSRVQSSLSFWICRFIIYNKHEKAISAIISSSSFFFFPYPSEGLQLYIHWLSFKLSYSSLMFYIWFVCVCVYVSLQRIFVVMPSSLFFSLKCLTCC